MYGYDILLYPKTDKDDVNFKLNSENDLDSFNAFSKNPIIFSGVGIDLNLSFKEKYMIIEYAFEIKDLLFTSV